MITHRDEPGHEVALFYVGLSSTPFTFQFKDMEGDIDLIANNGIGHAVQLRAGPHELLIFFSKGMLKRDIITFPRMCIA